MSTNNKIESHTNTIITVVICMLCLFCSTICSYSVLYSSYKYYLKKNPLIMPDFSWIIGLTPEQTLKYYNKN